MSTGLRIAIALAVLAAIGGAVFWWRQQRPPIPTMAAPAATTAPTVPAAPPPAPAIRYPIPPPPSSSRRGLPSLADADAYLRNALLDLLGRKSVISLLRLDDVARRFVATVDNLATDNAPASMWPVNRTAGHFDTEDREGGIVIGPKNADRYAAFVLLAEGVDAERAAELYERLYPLFQRAYEELGYPGKYFNDRVVDVIDNLLATPAVVEPLKLRRIEVDGAVSGGGGLYLFDDPALEARSAGQKILLRMGHQNAAKLMAKLTELRRRIVSGPLAQTPRAK